MSQKYIELKYQGPFKGVNVSLPEDVIGSEYTPFMTNFILKSGEIRTRPRQSSFIPGTPDGLPMLGVTSFMDGNNIFHTVAITQFGLWQLNALWAKPPITSNKSWNLIANYTTQPGGQFPSAVEVFINKLFFTSGGANLWMWDGISSINNPRIWQPSTPYIIGSNVLDSNGNIQVASTGGISKTGTHPAWAAGLGASTTDASVQWTNNGKPAPTNGALISAGMVDATNGITAGGFFLVELDAQLLLLNTVEGKNGSNQVFPQRIRWCASGMPLIWDPNVNIGAGFNDELDVPDAITGAFSVGTTAFVLRTNGITEVSSNGSSGQNPFLFNHLWASDRGIGNVYPFGYASFGPIGIFISSDDIYNVSLGGFKRIGGVARDAIYKDLARATLNPIGSIVPFYSRGYTYNHYRLAIPVDVDMVTWIYSFDDESWQREFKGNVLFSGATRWSYTR